MSITFATLFVLLLASRCDATVYRRGHLDWAAFVTKVESLSNSKSGSYLKFIDSVNSSGLLRPVTNLLSITQKGVTVLLPPDSAWSRLPPSLQARLVVEPRLLKFLLEYHIIQRKFDVIELQKQPPGRTLLTLAGLKLQKWPRAPPLQVLGPLGAREAQQLVYIQQGNIYEDSVYSAHGIDKVLIPPNIHF